MPICYKYTFLKLFAVSAYNVYHLSLKRCKYKRSGHKSQLKLPILIFFKGVM